ncbi:MAG: 2Fe-2S iron-sulfur cluster-binding protein [Phycisphaerae bacterium]|jgi:predicted molibdopterin-dependent oxidoreductase YjgC|nr:2Fe-2S iron-sulfur cluster-binding protein [Phycisphaerae bacterium]
MPKLLIDNQETEVPEGTTVVDAAAALGIEIPTMCYLPGVPECTSCMVCVVAISGGANLVPACATKVVDGMQIDTCGDEVIAARRTNLELLLSDHVGDCIAPCQMADPNKANIPAIIRHVATGDSAAAAEWLAGVDGAKPQRACRRARKDQPVAIDLLLKHVAALADGAIATQASEHRFSVHIGKLSETELQRFMVGISPDPQVIPADPQTGYTPAEAAAEAKRCMHCDCRKADNCKLRDYSEACGAKPAHFRAVRREFMQRLEHPDVIYEPGKCICCGLCVRITEQESEQYALSFVGRGFSVQVAGALDRDISQALQKAAARCVEACPTGALAMRSESAGS